MDVVDLGAGEPDFPTPAHVTAAAHDALDQQVHEVHGEHGHHGAARGGGRRGTAQDYGVTYAA